MFVLWWSHGPGQRGRIRARRHPGSGAVPHRPASRGQAVERRWNKYRASTGCDLYGNKHTSCELTAPNVSPFRGDPDNLSQSIGGPEPGERCPQPAWDRSKRAARAPSQSAGKAAPCRSFGRKGTRRLLVWGHCTRPGRPDTIFTCPLTCPRPPLRLWTIDAHFRFDVLWPAHRVRRP